MAAGDHFAKPGANDRVWGALDKFARARPGRVRRLLRQRHPRADLRRPGWAPATRSPRRSTWSTRAARRRSRTATTTSASCRRSRPSATPRTSTALSPALTLQGAVAHVDMPVETGPTLYLPHSQKYAAGYLAFHQPEFTAYFDANHVQLPLAKGDAAFFNPALFHGAGTNRSADVRRMANLLQVSSAFGRAMETVDRTAMSRRAVPGAARPSTRRASRNVIAAVGRGLRLPHQPRPRPADRRPRPADPGRAGATGGRGALGTGRAGHGPA